MFVMIRVGEALAGGQRRRRAYLVLLLAACGWMISLCTLDPIALKSPAMLPMIPVVLRTFLAFSAKSGGNLFTLCVSSASADDGTASVEWAMEAMRRARATVWERRMFS